MRGARRWIRLALDAVLPPLCPSCGAMVGEPGALCPDCWGQITFLSAPCCDACGHPFEIDAGPGALCGLCAREAPPWARARAVFRYDDASKPLVLRLKHADRLEGAPTFARWLARSGADLIHDADLIVPVPLHRLRLLSRRYNQAAVLANALGRLTGKPVAPDLLVRTRATPAQGHLGRDERAANVRGAFAVRPSGRHRLAGKRVLLVDDVLTTGATVGECARILVTTGAHGVDVLTLGRVVLPHA
ncbi:ComF family protein [Magnetospirillum moscoviense]|uniref:Competence protein ComF n=1 Tax=Magnetospirillum moscoviense TaxID=1437059 RepID=A0A178MQG4_9PROT|nr:ComF family protein [Magnetospirillum moscoviense]OAN51154.1 competence protein ComF [Magnetospirillum moscoviense]